MALLALACGGRHKSTEPAPAGPPGTGPGYSIVHPSPEADRLAADFRGSCAFARPPGPAGAYRLTLRTRESPIGTIRVRSQATFTAGDREHILGEVPSGTRLRAAGPLRSGASAGLGYAVLVRDPMGRVCRGYVSEHSVVAPAGATRPGGD